MTLRKDYVENFNKGAESNRRFWERHGGMPPTAGKRVLEAGCGLGRMCIDLAHAGASKVIGVDIEQSYLDFAQENLDTNHPNLAGIVEFRCLYLQDYHEEPFDYIVSKEAFEHFLDLPGMLKEMKRCLKPGGMIYTGFGPLWNSPYGDHRMARCVTPWGHLMRSDEAILRAFNRTGNRNEKHIDALGLNRLSLADYRRIFHESGMRIVRFAVNQSSSPFSKIFSLFAAMPPLREYFTHNIYCILEKIDE